MTKHLLALCVAATACTSNASTGISTVSCPAESNLTYANFGSGFMTDNCLECHTTKEKPALATQAEIRANAPRILQAAVYTTAMPNNNDMALGDRELLGEWLACGAP